MKIDGAKVDVAIVGGGIVGLATAYRLRHRRVVVLEKEPCVAAHQTGRNSGVLHSGIYYAPGSLKARNCRRGKAQMEAFCTEHAIPFERCGKLIVASDESQLPRLDALRARGQANGVSCERIGPERLRELEPHATGIAALHVPEAGIVDYGTVARRLAELAHVATATRVLGVRDGRVRTTRGTLLAKQVICCAGLHADRLARRPPLRIVPFRGEYYELLPEARERVRGLIYPVPDPALPFLGVHLTKTIDGRVECGPNAVLALAREGYRWRDISPHDLAQTLSYRGFWRLAARHWRSGAAEVWRSVSKAAFVRSLQRLMPSLQARELVPATAGVRAQAVAADGAMVDDFVVLERGDAIHVCNAPSPAATASLAIAEQIAAIVEGR